MSIDMIHAQAIGRFSSLDIKEIVIIFLFGIVPDLPLTFFILTGRFLPQKHFHHRWVIHTPTFWIITAIFIYLIVSKYFAIWLLLSTLLHLATDGFGGGDGIPFLYPFTKKRYGVLLGYM